MEEILKCSINDLEELVKKGEMKKKVTKSTYFSEALSTAWDCTVAGFSNPAPPLIGAALAVFVSHTPKCETPTDIYHAFCYGWGMFSAMSAVFASFPLTWQWRERVDSYVKYGKITYSPIKGNLLRFSNDSVILPANHGKDPDEKFICRRGNAKIIALHNALLSSYS